VKLGFKCSTCKHYGQVSAPPLDSGDWASHRDMTVMDVCLKHNEIEKVKRTGECDDYELDPTTLLQE